MTPAWLLDLLAALMLVIAAVSAARLVAARPWEHRSISLDTDVAHLLMGIAMAGMFTASLTTLSGTAWEVIFALLTAWFAVRVVVDSRANGARSLAGGHCAPHLVHSAAMIYMFAAISMPSGGMSGMAGMGAMSGGSGSMSLDVPTLAFVFAVILIAYSIWDLDQLSGRRYRAARAQVSLAGVGAMAVPAAATVGGGEGALTGSQAEDPGTPLPVGGQTSHEAPGEAAAWLLSPGITVACRVVMGVAMAFMLIIAI
jgi:hypothetical protein